jgi:hypothetical protein
MSTLLIELVVGVRTYATYVHVGIAAFHTFHVAPASCAVPTTEPAGCAPDSSIQIMSSAPLGWPLVVGVWLNQMSYATSQAPEVSVVDQLVVTAGMLPTCTGKALFVVQLPQWQPL